MRSRSPGAPCGGCMWSTATERLEVVAVDLCSRGSNARSLKDYPFITSACF